MPVAAGRKGNRTAFPIKHGDAGAGLYTKWNDPQPAWSNFRNATWGHGRWVVLNATHSEWTWHQNSQPTTEAQDTYVLLNANKRVW